MRKRIMWMGLLLTIVAFMPSQDGSTTTAQANPQSCCSLVGDFDDDGLVDYWDYINILHGYVLQETVIGQPHQTHPPEAPCLEQADVNGDCAPTPTFGDYTAFRDYLYLSGFATPTCPTCQ